MEDNKVLNVSKEARKVYGAQLIKTFPFLLFFFLVTVMVWLILFLVDYSGAGSLFMTILVVGLVEMPFFLAVQISSYMAMIGRDIPFSHFFRTSTLYFKREFNGVYRVINCFLIAFLIAFGVDILFSIVYYSFSPMFDPAFIQDVEALMEAMSANETGTLETIFENSTSINLFINLNSLTLEGTFCLITLIKISRNSALVFVRDFLMSPDPRVPDLVYKDTVRNNKQYNKDFWKATWFIYVLIALSYIGGAFIAYYLFKDHEYLGMLMNMMGIGVAIIPTTILLPYFFNVIYFLTTKYKKTFQDSSVRMAKMAFEQLKDMAGQLTEEQKKQFEEALKQYEDRVNDPNKNDEPIDTDSVEKEDEDKDDDDHNDSDLDDYGSSDHH